MSLPPGPNQLFDEATWRYFVLKVNNFIIVLYPYEYIDVLKKKKMIAV
jgi:hypothetical protein